MNQPHGADISSNIPRDITRQPLSQREHARGRGSGGVWGHGCCTQVVCEVVPKVCRAAAEGAQGAGRAHRREERVSGRQVLLLGKAPACAETAMLVCGLSPAVR
eukprot:TRINITY_DN631_c0_g1_i1.p2 TRINITY_DN631_c0_g1~~TRINITY_DN631_c0_g1_i1.p2  ORF type:complete len:104 (-),score=8.52 TRINITY_DN631_c0_g1_i1:492-803(-)